jgi:methylphosphotriester-DNA--protein-cysteine methyltransferase
MLFTNKKSKGYFTLYAFKSVVCILRWIHRSLKTIRTLKAFERDKYGKISLFSVEACKLIQNEAYSIADVCYESGYNNLTNFNKFFKSITGLTPSKYRKKLN